MAGSREQAEPVIPAQAEPVIPAQAGIHLLKRAHGFRPSPGNRPEPVIPAQAKPVIPAQAKPVIPAQAGIHLLKRAHGFHPSPNLPSRRWGYGSPPNEVGCLKTLSRMGKRFLIAYF